MKRSVSCEGIPVRDPGGIRSANADISNDKEVKTFAENPRVSAQG